MLLLQRNGDSGLLLIYQIDMNFLASIWSYRLRLEEKKYKANVKESNRDNARKRKKKADSHMGIEAKSVIRDDKRELTELSEKLKQPQNHTEAPSLHSLLNKS